MLVLRANVEEEGLREGSEALVLRGVEHPLARLGQLEDEFAAISARLEETLDTLTLTPTQLEQSSHRAVQSAAILSATVCDDAMDTIDPHVVERSDPADYALQLLVTSSGGGSGEGSSSKRGVIPWAPLPPGIGLHKERTGAHVLRRVRVPMSAHVRGAGAGASGGDAAAAPSAPRARVLEVPWLDPRHVAAQKEEALRCGVALAASAHRATVAAKLRVDRHVSMMQGEANRRSAWMRFKEGAAERE